MTRLVLLRHGETTWNRAGRVQGQLDPPLSELGRCQARRAADALAGSQVTAIHTSDLRRARETAAAVEAGTGVPARPAELLREHHMGTWQGLTPDAIRAAHPDAWAA